MTKFEKVGAENFDLFFDAMQETPKKVILAKSDKDFQTGVPVWEMLLPPRHRVMMIVGVALQGTCAIEGTRQNLALDHSGVMMTRPAEVDNTLQGWTVLKKDGEPLHLFIPQKKRVSNLTDV